MKKILLKITTVFFVCFMMMGAISAYNRFDEPVSLRPGASFAESDATSYGLEADYMAKVSSSSKNIATLNCMAGWKGGAYPYTTEYSTAIPIGATRGKTVTQSRTSRFYIKLFSHYYDTTADGLVSISKW